MTIIRALVVCVAACAAVPAAADVWDVNVDHDNDVGTDNELVHGSIQLHDLGVLASNAADQDWYRFGQAGRSSYEIVIDATSGDISSGRGVGLDRMAYDGTSVTLLQAAQSITPGMDYARSLRWENTEVGTVMNQYARVSSTSCSTDCGPDDIYRVRFYETTFAIPRFNVSATQTTVLLVQNPTSYSVVGRAYFWSATGNLEHTLPFSIEPRSLYSLILSTVPILVGKSGTITLSHTARYGDLVGKTVAVEPGTGFSFDSPMVWRPR